jgi:hypothetical protein
MREKKFLLLMFTGLFIVMGLSVALTVPEAGATDWPSWRRDLQNTGAAPDSGYPTTLKLLWNQTLWGDSPANTWAGRCTTPVVVGSNIIITTGNDGLIQARDQVTGNLIWSKTYNWLPTPPAPLDAPANWCQGSDPNITLGYAVTR